MSTNKTNKNNSPLTKKALKNPVNKRKITKQKITDNTFFIKNQKKTINEAKKHFFNNKRKHLKLKEIKTNKKMGESFKKNLLDHH